MHRIQVQNCYCVRDVNSEKSAVHQCFSYIWDIFIGTMILEPYSVQVTIHQLLEFRCHSLIMIRHVIVANGWDEESVRENFLNELVTPRYHRTYAIP